MKKDQPGPFKQALLEDRLGNALGLAIYMLRHPNNINDASMARVEAQFTEWLNSVVDRMLGYGFQPDPDINDEPNPQEPD